LRRIECFEVRGMGGSSRGVSKPAKLAVEGGRKIERV